MKEIVRKRHREAGKGGNGETKKGRRRQRQDFLEVVQGGEQASHERGKRGEKKEQKELVGQVTRHFGVVNAALEDIPNREEKMEDDQWEKEIARHGKDPTSYENLEQEGHAETSEDCKMCIA